MSVNAHLNNKNMDIFIPKEANTAAVFESIVPLSLYWVILQKLVHLIYENW